MAGSVDIQRPSERIAECLDLLPWTVFQHKALEYQLHQCEYMDTRHREIELSRILWWGPPCSGRTLAMLCDAFDTQSQTFIRVPPLLEDNIQDVINHVSCETGLSRNHIVVISSNTPRLGVRDDVYFTDHTVSEWQQRYFLPQPSAIPHLFGEVLIHYGWEEYDSMVPDESWLVALDFLLEKWDVPGWLVSEITTRVRKT